MFPEDIFREAVMHGKGGQENIIAGHKKIQRKSLQKSMKSTISRNLGFFWVFFLGDLVFSHE